MIRSILFFIIFCNSYCFSQEFNYREISKEYYDKKSDFIIDISSFKDITKYLPEHYVTDGTVDYTIHLQKALNENRNILMPNFPILVNDSGLDIMNNSVVYFQKKSSLHLKPSDKRSYQIIRIKDKSNIKIYNPKIYGDRNHHLGNNGEWGMGISITGSKNIEILNCTIKNCWGDGIYVGHSVKSSSNVTIQGGIIDNNRRNGISVISVEKLLIKNVLISNTNGINPNTGIDIEPNYYYNNLNDIRIENVITYNNKINGILIHLAELPGIVEKKVSIDIINHTDYLSQRPIRVSSALKKDLTNIKPLKGSINIRNFKSFNNPYDGVINSNKYFPNVNIKNSNFKKNSLKPNFLYKLSNVK